MDLAFAAGSVWAELDSGVARLDPSSLSVGPGIVIPRSSLSCGGLAADDSAVWVASGEGCFGRGGLSAGLARVDPSTNHVSTLSIGVPWDVAIGLGSVWTTDADRVLRRFNPSTGALEGTLSIPVTGASVVTAAGEGVLVGDANGRLLELAPT